MSSEFTTVSTDDVRSALRARHEIALFDVRDEKLFAEGHPLFAASLPFRGLGDVAARVPRPTTRIVLYDNGEGLTEQVAAALRDGGYRDVAFLRGGLEGWRAAGGELFQDVNVPSKAFGELVEVSRHTPSIPAEQLRSLLDQDANLVVLDARPFHEYRTMSIPTAVNVPGGELVYRVGEMAPNPETMVVVNCAGRTRSIIGAQSLVNAGIPNPVVALRNGTIGWLIAGFSLEHGQTRRAPAPSGGAVPAAAAARALAARAGVDQIDRSRLDGWVADTSRTVYRFDVRTPEEFAAGHLAGFRSAPGGQLVQATDAFAPVRGARVVLADNDATRASMTASWLAQMGWEVYVLAGGLNAGALEVTTPDDSTTPASGMPDRGAGESGLRSPDQAPADHAYKRPYEGTDNPKSKMQAYLDWEAGLVAQLDRDRTHGFRVI